MEKDRVAAVFLAHLYGRKWVKGGMRPCDPPHQYGRKWKKTELRPCASLIYSAARGKKEECGRATLLINTAANEKRQNCGRTNEQFAAAFHLFIFGEYDLEAIGKKSKKGINENGSYRAAVPVYSSGQYVKVVQKAKELKDNGHV